MNFGASSTIYMQAITAGAFSSGSLSPARVAFPVVISLPDGNLYVSPSPSVGTYGFLAAYSGGGGSFSASDSMCKLLTVGKANTTTLAAHNADLIQHPLGTPSVLTGKFPRQMAFPGNTATGNVVVVQTGVRLET